MGPFPSSFRNQYILLVVDFVSKWVEAIALPANDTKTIVRFMRKNIFARFGTSRALFEASLAECNIRHRMTMAYHPQANRQAKMSNHEIKQILEKIVNPSQKYWAARLDDALQAYKIAYNTPLGMSPHKLVYGKNCHLPIQSEKKAYWAIKELNLDPKLARKERLFQLQVLEEFHFMAYENTKMCKERSRLGHYTKIQKPKIEMGRPVHYTSDDTSWGNRVNQKRRVAFSYKW
ncbi:Pol polyprotein [Gossypium australe]|uniref:Pol polyprotein n=1 Tax=Gossypium australe TaxID=47621 RepID=A0A5B6VL33_9ROSI|nr:Pol polyprotein [Gossypium australe]